MMDDLTDLLKNWSYEPGRVLARIVERGGDAPPCLHVRIELGLLQMELAGRPDGRRPDGLESLLHLHKARRSRYTTESGTASGFVLSPEDCRGLREECVQYYHRYVAFFALGRFLDVVRDTTRNLEVFEFCHECAAEEPDRQLLEQFRCGVVMMRSRAEAEDAIAGERPGDAVLAIDRGLDEIRSLMEHSGEAGGFETLGEVQLLRGMRDALVPRLPASQRVELEERLRAALDSENYELAAILRDELRLMRD